MKKVIHTDLAPAAIGPYSQAIQYGNLVFVSGQIGFDPQTMTIASDFAMEVKQVFLNLKAVVEASHHTLTDIVKLTIYLTDMADFPVVNAEMEACFVAPYPARATIAVKALPRGARVEVEAVVGSG
ncbi:MAG: reactive intermediate/imine deaminase [Gammaproteobacteria bacterium RIFCSPHIGHO2_12_FULL_45_9]|nr:MAG: reactive intermediate/imine deaminase [Gammaproteobacteria bacterium RIFCSPHIGHO2_12_FULL_45_9]